MPDLHPIGPKSDAERIAGTWTISSRTHDALAKAQARFVPRDPDFALEGYIFEEIDPTLRVNPITNTLLLRLPSYCEQDFDQAVYQLLGPLFEIPA
jgi:hypothetical protein